MEGLKFIGYVGAAILVGIIILRFSARARKKHHNEMYRTTRKDGERSPIRERRLRNSRKL